MPASATTPNFELPQYRALDTVSMLVTFNGAMSKIDGAMQSIKTLSDSSSISIDSITSDLEEAIENINALKTQVAFLQTFRNNGSFYEDVAYPNEFTIGSGISGLTYTNMYHAPGKPLFKMTARTSQNMHLNDMQKTPSSIFDLYTVLTHPTIGRGILTETPINIGIWNARTNEYDYMNGPVHAFRQNSISYFTIAIGKNPSFNSISYLELIM